MIVIIYFHFITYHAFWVGFKKKENSSIKWGTWSRTLKRSI